MIRQEVKKGIILAAGDGDRLGLLTLTCPKVLLPLNNREPLITRPIRALVAAGINEIAIVVGYLGDRVRGVLGDGTRFGARLQYIVNPDYLKANAISLYRARDWADGEPVVLCMGDHLIGEEVVRRLLDRQALDETLCVDYTPAPYHEIAEATRVSVDSAGCITEIGKDLAQWDAVDMGVFLLTEKFFQALHELVQRPGSDVEITDVVRFLIGQGHRFDTCNASGCFWVDVDTEKDLITART